MEQLLQIAGRFISLGDGYLCFLNIQFKFISTTTRLTCCASGDKKC